MPLYEYECTRCGHLTELLQRHGDPPLQKCPECGGAVRKLFSAPAVQFKGTGWYVTDYAGKGKPAAAGKTDGKAETSDKPAAGGSSADKAPSAAKSAKSSGSKE